ncbi:WapI family immunity protein [Deinococcus cavernae]|uniref:WapI family immunity protein n=1 Tax=Deinococcus cavernae TaxID=2320857 RepID=UPI003B75B54E
MHGYQFPENSEYWDANWLVVPAKASGLFLMTAELAHFRDEISMLCENLDGEAGLWTTEPELRIRLESKSPGAIEAEIELTPNQ